MATKYNRRLISKNYYLNKSAKDGYRGYLHSYASHSLKHIFDVHELDLVAVAKSFGFTVPPKVSQRQHVIVMLARVQFVLVGDKADRLNYHLVPLVPPALYHTKLCRTGAPRDGDFSW